MISMRKLKEWSGSQGFSLALDTDPRSRYENISKLTDALERVFEGQG
jgi:hypothetical protein